MKCDGDEELHMPVIGTFRTDKDGYSGSIRTLSLNAKVRIVANDQKQTASAPDFRVFLRVPYHQCPDCREVDA